MIDSAHPEWADKTIAMLNCELPAYDVSDMKVVSVPEFRTLVNKLVAKSGLVLHAKGTTLDAKAVDATNMEDGVSYRWHGTPYFINGFEGSTFMSDRYHTSSDDKSTWCKATMTTNLDWYGAFAIYIDKTPALELDMTCTCDDLEANLAPKIAKKAGVDVDAYNAEAEKMRTAAQGLNDQINKVNSDYEKAVKNGGSDEDIAALRDEGKALNKKSLAAFKEVQNQYLKADDVNVYIGHPTVNDNARTLTKTIAALDKKDLTNDKGSGVLDIIGNLNSYHDWAYASFSKKVGDDINAQYDPEKLSKDLSYWGTDKLVPVVYVGDTTYELYHTDKADIDYTAAKTVYQEALDGVYKSIKTYCDQEVSGMQKISEMMQ